jgi:hypothetical protein
MMLMAVVAGCKMSDSTAEKEIVFDRKLAQQVVQEVQAGRIVLYPDASRWGLAPLPKRFASAAWNEHIYITHWRDGTLLVFFPTGGCRGGILGFLYSSKPLKGTSAKNIHAGGNMSGIDDVPLSRQVDAHWWRIDGPCDHTT